MRTLHFFVLTGLTIFMATGSIAQDKKASPPKDCPKAAFKPACKLPFDLTSGLSIDATCGIDGCEITDSAEAKQNHAKNNFCASASGKPVTVTPDILAKLQAVFAADAVKKGIPFGGQKKLPPDRTLLKGYVVDKTSYSEGMYVQMVAFIIESHSADLSSGENVNCDVKKDAKSNDIHIALGSGWGADECTSVTAEMSPHFRPTGWSVLDSVEAKGKIAKQPEITQFPIRIRGQLMLDATHELCTGTPPVEVKGNPARRSMWEIHPVYSADVCQFQDVNKCNIDSTDSKVWTPLSDWKPAK
jgi:hypothetical protein